MTPPRLHTAQVIAVGSELLGSTRVDTNSLFLSECLASLGIELRSKVVVGDNRRALTDYVRRALERVDLVILTGGLGPTDDDVTREAVADALAVGLVEDPAIVAHIAQRFARRGLQMPDVNRRQALVLDGGAVLANPNGTAPGQMFEREGKLVLLFPGPPRELKPMMETIMATVLAPRTGAARLYRRTLFITGKGESHVEEIAQPIYSRWLERTPPIETTVLAPRTGAARLYRRTLFITGKGESHVEEIAQPIYSRWLERTPPIETTVLAAPGQVELHLVMRSDDPASAARALDSARDQLASALGPDVFSVDGRSMEEVLGAMLAERGLAIAAAESCTGGLMMSRLTDVPGSSAYVAGGVVVYSNELKATLAGVDPALIATHGAVSEPVAAALAEGIKARTGASIGVAITGIAGPSGGTPQKPVGTVCIAAVMHDGAAQVRSFSLFGNRGMIKFWSSQYAMNMVRRMLIAAAPDT
jgi:PncC family amidohydrolase